MTTCLNHRLPSQRGTTLLELMLYVGVLGIVLTAAVAFSIEFLATSLKADAGAEAAWNARFAVGRLAAEIRQAGNYGTDSTFGANAHLVLCPASLTSCTAATGTVFALNAGGQLTAAVAGGTAQPLTSPKVIVTDFTVTNLSTDSSLPASARSRNFAVTVRTVYKETGLWVVAPEATYQTTERIRRSEGFAH